MSQIYYRQLSPVPTVSEHPALHISDATQSLRPIQFPASNPCPGSGGGFSLGKKKKEMKSSHPRARPVASSLDFFFSGGKGKRTSFFHHPHLLFIRPILTHQNTHHGKEHNKAEQGHQGWLKACRKEGCRPRLWRHCQDFSSPDIVQGRPRYFFSFIIHHLVPLIVFLLSSRCR